MARKKPEIKPITDLQECNEKLAEACAIERRLNEIDNQMNTRIDQAKADAAQQSRAFKAELERIQLSLSAYAEYHKQTLFSERKTIELAFGWLGFRKSTQISPEKGRRVSDVIATVREHGLRNALRIKESLNKDVMAEWSDAQLQAVGARRIEKDQFWYESKKETL